MILVLPQGASSACNIFNAFSPALNWIMFLEYEANGMSHILKDFPFSESEIGIPIKQDKTQLIFTKIIACGRELDLNSIKSRLHKD